MNKEKTTTTPKKAVAKKMDFPNWSINLKIFRIQNEIEAIIKDANNPYFKSNYADINAMLEQLQPLLNKYKVCIEQPINDGKVFTTLTCVETGQSKSSSLELQLVSDPQKLGSAITYYRRYTLQGLLGIRTKDDDANTASGKTISEMRNIKINEI
jgi:hypothetical protein|tara:strand:+ start:892 stop:1356 length:465 start_codon:yes stop_codon:yes gene_type:complete